MLEYKLIIGDDSVNGTNLKNNDRKRFGKSGGIIYEWDTKQFVDCQEFIVSLEIKIIQICRTDSNGCFDAAMKRDLWSDYGFI